MRISVSHPKVVFHRIILFVTLLICPASLLYAEICKTVSSDGIVRYSDDCLPGSSNGLQDGGEKRGDGNKDVDQKTTVGDPAKSAASINAGEEKNKEVSNKTTIKILVNPNTIPLHKMRKEEIFALRREQVKRYKYLYIFPDPYVPDNSIYGQIDERFDWLHDTQFFVVNPYLLVLTSGGRYVDALVPYCGVEFVEYSRNKIEVKYRGGAALKWFYYIYDYYPEAKGIVRLWLVNATDAGFKCAHIDMSRSVNIEPIDNAPSDSVLNGIYSGRDLYHVGKYNKNNISPDDARAKLRPINRNARTMIYVKLWRARPANINDAEDLAYVIDIEP